MMSYFYNTDVELFPNDKIIFYKIPYSSIFYQTKRFIIKKIEKKEYKIGNATTSISQIICVDEYGVEFIFPRWVIDWFLIDEKCTICRDTDSQTIKE